MARCPCSPGTATTALGHFGARFWFCRRIWPFPQLFEAETLLRWILSTTKGWIHRFISLHFNTSFISSHHLKKSWWILEKGTGFSSLVLVCWGDFFGFLQQYWSLFDVESCSFQTFSCGPQKAMAVFNLQIRVCWARHCLPKESSKIRICTFPVRGNITENPFSVDIFCLSGRKASHKRVTASRTLWLFLIFYFPASSCS